MCPLILLEKIQIILLCRERIAIINTVTEESEIEYSDARELAELLYSNF
jgi:hypothetical protein